MRVFRTIPALVLLVSSMSYAGELSYRDIDVRNQAIQQSLVPIRPGIPGERPFWNESSRRFIHVPSFDFKPVERAMSYLFTATSVYCKTELKFEAPSPTTSLTSIWRDLPVGAVTLKCEALDGRGGKVIGLAGERKFEKGASFSGPYYAPVISYRASAELALKGTFTQSHVRYWLENGKPDPSFALYLYPSKVIGAVVSGAAAYARLSPRPKDTAQVLQIGRAAADYLIACSLPAKSPLEHFPLTYQGKQFVKHADETKMMMIYPAEAGQAYLDLYDVVKDRKYLDAARSIANTYVKTQLPNGAWHLFVDTGTGKSLIATDCIPVAQILFLDRLSTHYRVAGLKGTIKKAVTYVMDGPMKTYDWHGQFEDVDPDQGPYKNLSRQEVCLFAAYLLDHSKERREWRAQAEELLAFAEDQFVVWQVAQERFSQDVFLSGKQKANQAYWITPSVLEQYGYYVPICRSMGLLLVAYQRAHQVTGKRIYLEKAKAIASALTVGQKVAMSSANGQFPTFFRTGAENEYPAMWINNTVYPAKYLLDFSEYLKKRDVADVPDSALPDAEAVLKCLTLKAPLLPNASGASHQAAAVTRESLDPVYPGIPGERLFWNGNARRFIHVPAFDFKTVDGAKSYLFTATSVFGRVELKFEAESPCAPLSPIWVELPIGAVRLKCEALDAKGGKVIGLAGERNFEKGAPFSGPYYKPETSYKESAELALKGTFKQGYIRYWLEHGKPDPSFKHYFYPSKTIGAVISGAATYSRCKLQPGEAEEVLQIGRIAADYLIGCGQPTGTPYEYFPPTYHSTGKLKHPDENVMVTYPAEAAEAYLDLYDVVREPKYLEAAKNIAGTYRKSQLSNGTWPLVVNVTNGAPVWKAMCTPTAIVRFLERLKLSYKVDGLDDVISRALKFTMDGPMQTYNWMGQFEDMSPDVPPYKNMARQEVCQLADYLLDHAKEHPDWMAQAEDLLRFAEDQFVVWQVAPEHFRKDRAVPKNLRHDQAYWITPTVLEQYHFYVPVCRSMGMLLTVYQKAHQVTGKQVYLEKAKAIANALTVGQKALMSVTDGQFPTLFSRRGEPEYPAKWINNTVYPAEYLLEFSEYLKKIRVSEASDPVLPNADAVLKSLTLKIPDPPIAPVSGRRSTSDIRKQALQESLVAIRPGIPGKQPFWNEFSRRFVYAPAFDFKAVEGAKSYLFTATSVYEKSTHKFEADSPNAPLTPMWLQIPVGHVVLKCEGLDASGGKVIGTAVERKFEKAASFEGPYYRPAMGYKESGELALKGTFKQGYIRYWLEHGKPDPSFAHYFYPAKVIGAVIAGSVVYSRIEPKPVDADEALKIGRIAADYLIAQSWPAGTRYEYFPPTYHNAAKRLPDDEIMTIYPAEAAEAYLDLYDVTRDEKYLSAAKKIANTYVKTQGPEGTWPLTVARDTGEPRCKTLCIPTAVVHFMERLKLHYEVKGLEGAISKAVKYTRDEPMRSFDWHGQFEDMHRDGPPYRNMARQEVCQMAAYLFDHAKENPAGVAQAEELLAYAEDQFVVWRVAPEYLDGRLKPGSPGAKNDQTNWITPSVLEQYGFYVPICRSIGMLLTAYQTAHRVTGKRIYLEKGKALADALTVGQKAFLDKVDGQFPTLFSTKGETDYPAKWINNAVYPAKYLLEFGEYLKTIGVPETSDLALLNAEAVLKSLTVEMSTLPKVLILGDSISIGYTQPTRKKLIGKAEVSRPRGNCQSTDFALKHIKEWLGDQKWDVIHFNWGIWDMHYLQDGHIRNSPEQYEKNLRELVGILKATGANLIWATTTPIGQRLPLGYTVRGEDVPVYNAVAAKLMQENGVAIDDLYSAVLPEVGKLRNEDATHYKPEGYEFLASRVAERIEGVLGERKPR